MFIHEILIRILVHLIVCLTFFLLLPSHLFSLALVKNEGPNILDILILYELPDMQLLMVF